MTPSTIKTLERRMRAITPKAITDTWPPLPERGLPPNNPSPHDLIPSLQMKIEVSPFTLGLLTQAAAHRGCTAREALEEFVEVSHELCDWASYDPADEPAPGPESAAE